MSTSAAPPPRAGPFCERALALALDFLQARQLPRGEFTTYGCRDRGLRRGCESDPSPFVTSFVLYALGFVQDPRARRMLERGLAYLVSEMEAPGAWRYWARRNPKHAALPPDQDDTCCIAFVLSQHGKRLPPHRGLLEANQNADGIFYTWLAVREGCPPPIARRMRRVVHPGAQAVLSLAGKLDTLDCTVNANAVLYLGQGPATERAIRYLARTVEEKREALNSPYYVDRFPFYYMLSRAYWNGVRALGVTRRRITARLRAAQARDGAFGNALQTALAACTLLNFDAQPAALARAVGYLVRAQRRDGSWKRAAMFLGPAPFYGSEELTTALCVEALARYQQRMIAD